MIERSQFRNTTASRHENYFGEGIRQLRNKLRRSASVSRQPIDHPGVGGVVVALPRRSAVIGFPMSMGESSGVLVMRIARVGVLKRSLPKGAKQTRHYAKMEEAAHQFSQFYSHQMTFALPAALAALASLTCREEAFWARPVSPVKSYFARSRLVYIALCERRSIGAHEAVQAAWI